MAPKLNREWPTRLGGEEPRFCKGEHGELELPCILWSDVACYDEGVPMELLGTSILDFRTSLKFKALNREYILSPQDPPVTPLSLQS